MTHVVTQNCVDCKFTDCVSVCPVDCFYEDEKMLVIDPNECIDCAACVAECPVEAIYSEDELPDEFATDLDLNRETADRLIDAGDEPITEAKDPLPTAEEKKSSLGF